MFNYPKNLYTDVRIETVMTTNIVIENDQLKANKSKREKGALIRIYDGRRWYYKASSEVEKLQEAIDEPNEQVMDMPIVKKLEVNKDTLMVFDGEAFLNTANDEKMALVKHCASLIDADEIKMWQSIYQDRRIVKDFYSSKGSELHFDTQSYAMCLRYVIEANGQSHGGSYDVMGQNFDQLLSISVKSQRILNISSMLFRLSRVCIQWLWHRVLQVCLLMKALAIRVNLILWWAMKRCLRNGSLAVR